MKNPIWLIFILSSSFFNINAQEKALPKKQFFFVSVGYGLAGSFFVRSYEEFAPVNHYAVFYKKNFVGVAQNIQIGITLKKNYNLLLGYGFQHFTRKINFRDTISGVLVILKHTIHHRDYIWTGGINKDFEIRKHILSTGIGIYYLRSKQEEVEVYYPNLVNNTERDYKTNRLEEAGVSVNFSYEYKFQTKVNIGIRTQFNYTVSTGAPESVTLYPFIKLLL